MIGPTVGMVILVNTGNPPYPPDDSALTIRAIFIRPLLSGAGVARGAGWEVVATGRHPASTSYLAAPRPCAALVNTPAWSHAMWH